MKNQKIKNIVLTSVITALTAVLSQIAIPVPSGVPITLQTFAVSLSGYLLGLKYGVISTFIYISLGAIGIPVFSNFSGGIHFIFASPTGGFIIGFLFLSFFCGLSCLFKWRKHGKVSAIFWGLIGVFICHLCGCMQYASIASIPFTAAIVTVSLPFILKDAISVVLAYFLCLKINKYM